MSKFKVNDVVVVSATGEKGVVKDRDVIISNDGSRHTKIQYIVKLGNGIDCWKAFSKKELKKVPSKNKNDEKKYLTKVYDAPNGFKITLVALAETVKEMVLNDDEEFIMVKAKVCNIGHAIYNPSDVYDANFGYRIARKRIKTRPFAHMYSKFTGEFNRETVEAIMDAKAKYLINNLDNIVVY